MTAPALFPPSVEQPPALPPRNPGLTRWPNLLGFCVILGLSLVFPVIGHYFGDFWYGVAAVILIGIMYGLGLHIITGLTGMLNLGFVGCAAFGAYLGAWLLKLQTAWLHGAWVDGQWLADAGWSSGAATQGGFWLALVAVIGCSGLLGLVLGYPTLKLSGDYFAIVTLAFSEIIILAIKNLAPITGGTAGLRDIPKVYFLPVNYTELLLNNHYVMLAGLVVLCAAVLAVQYSRFGRALAALRDNRTAAEAAGISPTYYLTMASVISSIVGGIGGYLAAVFRFDLLIYENFLFMESVMVVCYVVIGGLGSFRGAIIGGICLASATELLRQVFNWWNRGYSESTFTIPGDLRYLIFGLVLIVAMRFMPHGLFGAFRRARLRTGQVDPAAGDEPCPGPWPHRPTQLHGASPAPTSPPPPPPAPPAPEAIP